MPVAADGTAKGSYIAEAPGITSPSLSLGRYYLVALFYFIYICFFSSKGLLFFELNYDNAMCTR